MSGFLTGHFGEGRGGEEGSCGEFLGFFGNFWEFLGICGEKSAKMNWICLIDGDYVE
jgi:hypothetical protein